MKECIDHNGKIEVNLSTDMGSEHNANNIMNILVKGIKEQLKVPQDTSEWYNEKTNTLYRFDTVYIIVKFCFIVLYHNFI